MQAEKKTTAKRCPICRGETVEKYKPFCSKRCADVDLNRWLTGSYRIPTDERPGEQPRDEDDFSL